MTCILDVFQKIRPSYRDVIGLPRKTGAVKESWVLTLQNWQLTVALRFEVQHQYYRE